MSSLIAGALPAEYAGRPRRHLDQDRRRQWRRVLDLSRQPWRNRTDKSYAASAVSYLWRGTRLGGDLIYGSGLRADLPLKTPIAFPDGSVLTAIPNGEELPAYTQVNLSRSRRFDNVVTGPYAVRLDVINLFDRVYQIRNGSGVGVFAPQFGPRRGFFVGLTKQFG